MLIGEYHYTIDSKGRTTIPSKMREVFGSSLVITRGLDGCLYIYSNSDFEKVVNKLNTLSFTKKDARTFNRFFMSGATLCDVDKQGRINIPSYLLSYASINKNLVIIGVSDHCEIWDEDRFLDMLNKNYDIINDISENLFERNDFDA